MLYFKTWVLIGAFLGLTGVALGAFGAHGLAARLEASGRADTFDTAVRYHLIHAVALVAIGALSAALNTDAFRWTGIFLTAGTVVFSGALYLLAIFDLGFMGAVAPIGGVLLILGWLALMFDVMNYRPPPPFAPPYY